MSTNNTTGAIWSARWLVICHAIYNLFSGIAAFNLSTWIYSVTQNPTYMALALFVNTAARTYPGFISGRIIDRFGKDTVLKFAAISIIFTYFIAFCFFASESKAVLLFVVVIELALGLTSLFYELAILSSISAFLPKDKYQEIYGFMELLMGTVTIVAPILGAIWFHYFKIHNVMLSALFSALPLLAATFFMKFPQTLKKATQEIRFSTSRFIKDNKILLLLLKHFCLFNFFNGLAMGIMSGYILKLFNGSANHLALINFCIAVGTVVGGLLALKNSKVNPILVITLGGIVAAVSGRIILGLYPSIGILCIAMAIRMGIIPLVNTNNQVVWSNITPVGVRGKVFGIRRMIAQGGYPLAIIIGGSFYRLCEDYFSSPGTFFIITGLLEILACIFLIYYRAIWPLALTCRNDK